MRSVERYFRAAMWFGRMGFVVSTDAGLQGAALIGAVWDSSPADLTARWNRVYNVTSFFVGPSDDLLPRDLAAAVRSVIGNLSASGSELMETETIAQLRAYLAALPDPRIVSGLVTDKQDPVDATKGLRFMGQRAVVDSEVFQQLV